MMSGKGRTFGSTEVILPFHSGPNNNSIRQENAEMIQNVQCNLNQRTLSKLIVVLKLVFTTFVRIQHFL